MTPSENGTHAPGSIDKWLQDDPQLAGDVLGELLQLVVAENLEQMRERAGITRAELAERIGCDPGFVTGVLNGTRNITLRTIGRFSVALHGVPALQPGKRPHKLASFGAFADEVGFVVE